mmetsp:Transcript_5350/g.13523  ORF Transcript_5350/g.13523 Transcript_5350/m.13523 type:complete len:315 (+) Transcript_5350:241-1185(+)
MATKIVALVGLSVVTLGANAKPYGGGGYYGKYGGGKYGGVSDSYDDGYYKGSKYGGYGYNAPKPKVSWWKPWSWKYAKKSYSYGDEYEYGYDNGLTKADLREAAHAYVGLSETLKRDEFRAIPMTPGTTTTTTTTTTIPNKDPNQFQCTCGCNVGHQAFACISFGISLDKDFHSRNASITTPPIQSVYQSVGSNKFIGTDQYVLPANFLGPGTPNATARFQGNSLPHYPGGKQTITVTATSVQFTDPNTGETLSGGGPFTEVLKQGEVTCRGPVPVIDECELRCNKAVDDELLERNEFEQKCWFLDGNPGIVVR